MNEYSDKIQLEQENEYWFPYHYVSMMPDFGFREHFVDTWGINYISTIEFILAKMSQQSSASILDIGCGDGRLTREIKLAFPEIKVSGIDYSSRAICLAKAMNYDVPEVEFFACDITVKPPEIKSDMAILMEVFEHVPINQCDKFLESVAMLLDDDGQLLLTVPHENKPVEAKHFQHFNVSSISDYIGKHFNILEVVPFERRGLIRKIMSKLLCNRFFTLNNQKLLNLIYSFQKKYLFYCSDETHCQRIFVRAVKK